MNSVSKEINFSWHLIWATYWLALCCCFFCFNEKQKIKQTMSLMQSLLLELQLSNEVSSLTIFSPPNFMHLSVTINGEPTQSCPRLLLSTCSYGWGNDLIGSLTRPSWCNPLWISWVCPFCCRGWSWLAFPPEEKKLPYTSLCGFTGDYGTNTGFLCLTVPICGSHVF